MTSKRRENINLVSFICLSFLVISFSKQLLIIIITIIILITIIINFINKFTKQTKLQYYDVLLFIQILLVKI